MNKRQWQILLFGSLVTVLIPALGTSRFPPRQDGPAVETSSGRYSQSFTDAVIPKWVVLTSLGMATLTGAAVYLSRKRGAA